MLQSYKHLSTFLNPIGSKHPLFKIAPLRSDFLIYLDNLIEKAGSALDALGATADERETLRSKLLDSKGFFPAVTELETLVHLSDSNLTIKIEPLRPNRGPDFHVKSANFECFVEDLSIGPEQSELDLDLRFEYVTKRCESVRSRYVPHFQIPDSYAAYSKSLKFAVNLAIRTMSMLDSSGKSEATLYLFPDGGHYLSDTNFMLSGFDFEQTEEKIELASRCLAEGVLSVHYLLAYDEPRPVSIAMGDDARWLDPRARVRGALHKKISQLVKEARNLLVVDISHAAAREQDVFDAVYGSVIAVVAPNAATAGTISADWGRLRDGFFKETTRAQAVVSVRRNVENKHMSTKWTVFPTNNPDASLRFSEHELRVFGELVSGYESLTATPLP